LLLLFDLLNLISAEGATSLQVGLYTRFSYNSDTTPENTVENQQMAA